MAQGHHKRLVRLLSKLSRVAIVTNHDTRLLRVVFQHLIFMTLQQFKGLLERFHLVTQTCFVNFAILKDGQLNAKSEWQHIFEN